MAVPKDTLWQLDPHTIAKHQLLRKYLDAWLPILGTYNHRVVYIDGFAGPGEYLGGEPGSPLIALDAALSHQATLAKELVFLFIEERADRVDHLKGLVNKLALPPGFKVEVVQGTFAENLTSGLDALDRSQKTPAPTFTLIDPFGFKGIPYTLIKRLLSKNRSEVLINFMVTSMNRFVEHPVEEIREHIVEAFGTADALKVVNSTGDRVEALRSLYHDRLREIARFVRYFEMRDKDNRVQYYLFFASNNPLGHLKMKEAMWKVDPNGDFSFSDATDPSQLLLFTTPTTAPLRDALVRKYQGQRRRTIGEVLEDVNDNTAYIKRHMSEVLQALENEQRVQIPELKGDGKKRRKGTYPDNAYVTFL